MECQIDTLIDAEKKFREMLKKRLGSIGENPVIKRINKNCFTINVNDLANNYNLCPYYYDWKWLSQVICSRVDFIPIGNIKNYFKRIIKEKRIEFKGWYYKLSDDYIEELKNNIKGVVL